MAFFNNIFIIVILIVAWFSMAFSETRFFQIRDDDRPIIRLDEFGFAGRGGLELHVSKFSYNMSFDNYEYDQYSKPDLSQVGFFLSTRKSTLRMLLQLKNGENFCPLGSNMVKKVLTFRYDVVELETTSTLKEIITSSVADDQYYSLFFANCIYGMKISMDLRSTMFNIGKNNLPDYLSAGETNLPAIYFLFSSAYFAFAAFWTHYVLNRRRRRGVIIGAVHFLLLAVLILKAFNLLCEAEKKSYVKVNGSTPDDDDLSSVNFLFYKLMSVLTGTALFTMNVLISTGWSFLKPYLLVKEKVALTTVVLLQLIANSNVVPSFVPIDNQISQNGVFLLVDVVCCIVWLIVIDWSIKSLREDEEDGPTAAAADEIGDSAKLWPFKHYYFVVICYIYFTRVVLFAWKVLGFTSYKNIWTIVVASELATLAFYVFTANLIRPDHETDINPGEFMIDDEEKAAIEPLMNKENMVH